MWARARALLFDSASCCGTLARRSSLLRRGQSRNLRMTVPPMHKHLLGSRRPLVLLSIFVSLAAGRANASNWYGKASPGGGSIAQCVEWTESIDDSFDALQQKFGPCTLALDGMKSVTGFVFHCERGATQLVFRRQQDCLALQAAMASGRHLEPEDFAPFGVKNKEGWGVYYDGCFTSGSPYAREHHQLQALANFCACSGEVLGQFQDKELPKHRGRHDAVAVGFNACSSAMYGKPIPEAYLAQLLASFAPAGKAKAKASPSGTRSAPSAVSPSVATPSRKLVRTGDSYAAVMETLKGTTSQQKNNGRRLHFWVEVQNAKSPDLPRQRRRVRADFRQGRPGVL